MAVLERISEIETEIEALRKELRAHHDNIGTELALRERNRHTEFLALVQRMNLDMDEDERFVVRTKLAQEFRRIIDVAIADPEGITVRLKPAPHQRVEFRFADHQIQFATLWSRAILHPDYPANDMRPIVKWPRDILLSEPDVIGLFNAYTGCAP